MKQLTLLQSIISSFVLLTPMFLPVFTNKIFSNIKSGKSFMYGYFIGIMTVTTLFKLFY